MEKDPKGKNNPLDHRVIKSELESILVATSNKLEREWPQNYATMDSAKEFFVFTFRIAINTLNTIMYICADVPKDPERERRYSLSIPPLNRTILENIITVIFVLEDIPVYVNWLYKAGWREWKEALSRYKRDYGHLHEWKPFIEKMENYVENPPAYLHLSDEEVMNPRKVEYWPNPGKMATCLKKQHPSSQSIAFVQYLNDWYYKELSGQSHLNVHGLNERGMFFARHLMSEFYGEKAEAMLVEKLESFRYKQIEIATLLILALASEIELHFRFGLDQRLKYIWGILINYGDREKEFYEKRYSDL